mmetsp:Transcript_26150/g.48778  ORF Transcript_26150/g.48778 Transcript_26150/m.48778 type:complete len:196 (+) Transcript_26150:303-890(+)
MTGSTTLTVKSSAEQALSTSVSRLKVDTSLPPPSLMKRSLKMPAGMKLPYTPSSLVTDASLASWMVSRQNSLQKMNEKLYTEMPTSLTRQVSFSPSTEHRQRQREEDQSEEPPPKRRRFQRRNSKTAAMLFSALSNVVPSDLETPSVSAVSHHDSETRKSHESSSQKSSLDGGLEIAEELVRQLKLRRQSIQQSL